MIARTCPECGGAFTTARPRKLFCTPAHGVAYNNRQLSRGQAVVGLAQAWRAARHRRDPAAKAAGGAAFRELCRLADAYTAEDRAAGRADPLSLFRRRQAAGMLDR